MELSDLKGLGPTRLSSLRAMGIVSLRDFLYKLPIRYEDHETEQSCFSASEGPTVIRGVVHEKPKIAYFRGMSRVSAVLRDETGSIPLLWYNQPWMVQQLPIGQAIRLYGRVSVKKGKKVFLNPITVSMPGWEPVYRAVKGIPAKIYRSLVREALSSVEQTCPETLPLSFRNRHHLMGLADALRQTHFPSNLQALLTARRRLSFESMLMYLAGVELNRRHLQPGYPMEIAPQMLEIFWQNVPFAPTLAQKRVLREIADDMRRNQTMARLVQGDVGCGKTQLAFGSAFLAWKAGYQTAMMAPTEILARQHYENALAQLKPLGIHCCLLTGSTRAKERRIILKELAEGSCNIVFGTHALISEGVRYAKLGLVITDEQHRFGVNQRIRLQEKGFTADQRMPHVLVMSATPIPRTLALILYGDLDLSVIDEMPPGRLPVKTRLVPARKRCDMYRFLHRQIISGHQAYIVCPLVEDSEMLDDVRSAKTLYAELTGKELAGLRVGLTWGQQKSDEKAEVLRAFASGEMDVLVATTVIEVGVNVPNATVMVIENAERYGLSQLHQLRGRVGRGSAESWCFLLSDASEKLHILCETNDGFAVAQKDLELRGPGDLMGTRQSGEALQGFVLDGDTRLLDEVIQSLRLIRSDPALEDEWCLIERNARDYIKQKGLKIALN